ncbi:MAG: S26 family signal peptidase [Vitreimonas sp.]
MRRGAGYLLVLTGGAAAAALTAAAFAVPRDIVLYNHSPSVPVGFYARASAPVMTGAFVTVRALDVAPEEARRRNFTALSDRFIKRIAAVGGDRVCGDGHNIVVGDGAIIVTVLGADEQHRGVGDRHHHDDDDDEAHGDARHRAGGAAGGDDHADDTHGGLVGWRGCRVLNADEVLLLGDTPDSFDGRYWGPINVRLIEGVWRRL